MKKKWGKKLSRIKNKRCMGNKFGITNLNEKELKEINGGLFMSVIAFLLASPQKVVDLVEGLKEGYRRGTTTP
jgi:bacteriocin-like protein